MPWGLTPGHVPRGTKCERRGLEARQGSKRRPQAVRRGHGRVPGTGTWRKGLGRAEERAREAGGSAVAQARDVVALVDADVDARGLHAPACLVVALEGERNARPESEDVRAHRLELVVGHLDELDPVLPEDLHQAHGHERQVDGREIDVERREERHEVEHLAGAVVVREVEGHDVDPGEQLAQRVDARVVRPVAAAHEQSAVVEPDRVAALGERGSVELSGDGDAGLDEIRSHGCGLAAAALLAGAQENRSAVGDDRRVVDVDRVRIGAVRRLGEHHLRAGLCEPRPERLVLRGRLARVRLGAPTVGLPQCRIRRLGRPHEHAAQVGGHVLTPILPGGNLHRVETTARLSGLEAGGGCAAKYSAARLEELLAGFAPAASENLLVGLAPADDAAVYKLDDERALIFTTDFFPPMVDDPALFGAVAAANALNDVFAMGGKPLLALSIAAFPEELPLEIVRAIFDAAAAKVQESGAVLAGGHTIRDDEPKYGLAVVGTVHPEGLWRKSEARAGDALFLTKPLGTGLVLAGAADHMHRTSSRSLTWGCRWPLLLAAEIFTGD